MARGKSRSKRKQRRTKTPRKPQDRLLLSSLIGPSLLTRRFKTPPKAIRRHMPIASKIAKLKLAERVIRHAETRRDYLRDRPLAKVRAKIAYYNPVCAARRGRRAVLFARDAIGSGRKGPKYKRYTEKSKVRC